LDFDLSSLSDDERMIVGLLRAPRSLDELVREAHMPANIISTIISSLEIQGIIIRRLGMIERVI
jgi:predicted Rossmann fold nucleotide-binding protein DprA/Smf involved in DNA uptake